jgi:hypothetical protein
MSTNIPFAVASSREIERRRCQPPVSGDAHVIAVPNWAKHAKIAWPFKTAAHLASLAGTSERHAARWLSGEFEPPACVAAALINEIFKRD